MLLIRTSTGREVNSPLCGVTYLGNLAIVTEGLSIPEAVEIFSDPNETYRMEHIVKSDVDGSEEVTAVYDGYVVLDRVVRYYGSPTSLRISLLKSK